LPTLGRLTGRGNTASVESVLASRPDVIADYGTINATYISLAERVQKQTGVPYLLFDGAFSQIARVYMTAGDALGIGERLFRLAGLPQIWIVIIYPGFPISTAWVYKNLATKLTKPRVNTSIAASLKSLDKLAGLLVNDLESVTLDRYPRIRLFKDKLLREGAAGGLMSGSGSAVFGIFNSKTKAQKAFHRLRNEEGVDAFLVHVLS